MVRPARAPYVAALVRLRGEHDLASAPALRDTLHPIFGDVLVDLSDCTFIDSSVIGALITASQELEREGHTLALVVPPENVNVARTLEIVRMRELLRIHPAIPGGRASARLALEHAVEPGVDRAGSAPGDRCAGDGRRRSRRPSVAGRGGGMPNGSRAPCTTSVATATASSSGRRLAAGEPRARGGTQREREAQDRRSAPVAAAVRQATRAPDERPPTSTRQARAAQPRGAARRPTIQASSRCAAGGGGPAAGDAVGLLDEGDADAEPRAPSPGPRAVG